MSDTLLLVLKFAAALGCGLMAGLFFAFSVAVMTGLARIAPSLLYLAGSIAVTMVFNVPLNNELAAAAPSDPAAANLWSKYLATWTAWNHLRTVACLAAASFLTMAIYAEARG